VALSEPAAAPEGAWLPRPSLRVTSPAWLRPDCQLPLLTLPTADTSTALAVARTVPASRAATESCCVLAQSWALSPTCKVRPVVPGSVCSRCARSMLAAPRVQLPAPLPAWLACPALAAWSLRRNRPLGLVGRLKPGRLNGLICCWARLGGNCRFRTITGAMPVPVAPVFRPLAAPLVA